MTAPNQLNELLEEAGLQDSAVEKLVDEYAAMQTRLVEEEYEEVRVLVSIVIFCITGMSNSIANPSRKWFF